MVAYLVAAVVSLLVSITGTPLLIRILHKKQYGQFIRQDGPTSHFTKRGTPTMGGLVMIIATVLGYLAANLFDMRTPRASGLLLLFLIVGLGVATLARLVGLPNPDHGVAGKHNCGAACGQTIHTVS